MKVNFYGSGRKVTVDLPSGGIPDIGDRVSFNERLFAVTGKELILDYDAPEWIIDLKES